MTTMSYGPEPKPRWLAIADLRINAAYQRSIDGEKSKQVINQIVGDFRWAACQAILACADGKGRYNVLDGQHRLEAARRLKIARIPAVVLPEMSVEDQAEAFRMANTQRVAMSTTHLYHAQLAAGAKDALAVASVLKASGLSIPRYPKAQSHLETGETLAVKLIYRLVGLHPRAFLVMALRAAAAGVADKPGELSHNLIAGSVAALADLAPDKRAAGAVRLTNFLKRLKPLELPKLATKRRASIHGSAAQATAEILVEAAGGEIVRRAPAAAESRVIATGVIPPDLWSLMCFAKRKGWRLVARNQALTVFGLDGERVTRQELFARAKEAGLKAA